MVARSIESCDAPRHICDSADAAHLDSRRLVDFDALLHENADLPWLALRLLRGLHAKRSLDRDGEQGSRARRVRPCAGCRSGGSVAGPDVGSTAGFLQFRRPIQAPFQDRSFDRRGAALG